MIAGALVLLAPCARPAVAQPVAATRPTIADTPTDALIYSTMPSTRAHSPKMAMDGDPSTYFQTVYGMSSTDDVRVILTRTVAVQSIRIVTGDEQNQNIATDAMLEISPDGVRFSRVADFAADGTVMADLKGANVRAFRIKLKPNRRASTLIVREITVNAATPVTHAQYGPGRGWHDLSRAPDPQSPALKTWAETAERKMESYWAECNALLYSPGFISPNSVNVIYRTGPGVTGVAAAGGGVITVNTAWTESHPEDTGLTVHEMSHVIQSYSGYNPVWLVEGISDYIRWVAYEPENYKVSINPDTANYNDSYRTTGAFLAWVQNHYDSRIVNKLSDSVRFGRYKESLWQDYTGKDVKTLWSEFTAAVRENPQGVIVAPLPLSEQPRVVPAVAPGASVPVDLAKFYNAVGFVKDKTAFGADQGFDGGGAAFSSDLLATLKPVNNVVYNLSKAAGPNTITSAGQAIALPQGNYQSLHLLASAVGGNQTDQKLVVTYADGTTQKLEQNFSDWFTPGDFTGETRALKMDYRNDATGTRDARPFYAYSYAFPLDKTKTVASLTLPSNPYLKIIGVSLGK